VGRNHISHRGIEISRRLSAFLLVLCTAALCRAQGMSSGVSDVRLAESAKQKSGAELLSDLRSARMAVAANPSSADAYLCLGLALQSLGQADAAGKAYDQALSLKPTLTQALYQKGVLDSDKQLWTDAEELFRRALATSGHFVPARLELAETLLRTGEFDAAEQELHAILQQDSNNAGAHYGLGLIFLQKGEIDGAVEQFHKSLAIRPDFLEAQKGLAEAFMLQSRWAKATALLAQAFRASPHSTEVVTAYARALQNAGEKTEAEKQFQLARQLSSDEASTLRAEGSRNFGVALRNEGKFTEALAAFRQAIQESPNFCKAHDDLGAVLWQQQQFAEASAEFAKAVECNPNLASARNNLGIAQLYFKHDVDGAIEQFRSAVSFNPGFTLAHFNLGKALATKNQYSEAESEFRRTIELSPEMGAAHVALGLLWAASGGKLSSEAKSEINQGLHLDPNLRNAIPQEYAAQLN
jgi:protein O-GlcNAc transferase